MNPSTINHPTKIMSNSTITVVWNGFLPQPTVAGDYLYIAPNRVFQLPKRVKVEHGSASGLHCKELQQGGSIHCGFEPWKGGWKLIAESEETPKKIKLETA